MLTRTARTDAADSVFRPRGRPVEPDSDADLSHVIQIYVEEPGADELFDIFEQWRLEMASRHPVGTAERTGYRQAYLRLFEAFGSGLSTFLREVRSLPDAVLAPDWRY